MLKIDYSVVIDRPLAEVFTYVTDIENMPVWSSEVEKAWKTSEAQWVRARRLAVRPNY